MTDLWSLKVEHEIELLSCRYGKMLAFRSDEVISRSLRLYGEWAQHELSYLRRYVLPGSAVIDVGAHIGTHALAFARWVAAGQVLAVEAHPVVASVLVANCLLNRCSNVSVVNRVCSENTGSALAGVTDPANLGATRFTSRSTISRIIMKAFRRDAQDPCNDTVALDDLPRFQKVSLIKVDTEGMELLVLRGARNLLRSDHPVVFCEQNDEQVLEELCSLLEDAGYALYWLETHPFNRSNYLNQRENVWWRTETGILAVPCGRAKPSDLRAVHRDDLKVRTFLNARDGTSVTLQG